MRRRAYLASLATIGVAGCSGDAGEDTPADSQRNGTPRQTTATSTAAYDSIAEAKEQAKVVPYEELFRNIDQYRNESVYYEFAAVYQAIYEDEYDYLRMNVSTTADEWQGDVAAWYYGDARILEDDRMEVWGIVTGLHEYETTEGNVRSTPAIAIADYELREETPMQ